MRLRRIFLGSFVAIALTSATGAADIDSSQPSQDYREYLEATREAEAAYRRDNLIRMVAALGILAGYVGFFVLPAGKRSRQALENSNRAMALAERQQKVLEEIRDLLKRP